MHMAKGKSTTTPQSKGSKPLQAQRPSKVAPDAPSLRPADGKVTGNSGAKLSRHRRLLRFIREILAIGLTGSAELAAILSREAI